MHGFRRLFDHLVSPREQGPWHREAERLGRRKVDHQLELGRQLDRKITGLLAFEDTADIDTGAAIGVGDTGRITQ
jgi:hypothetical protein